MVALPGICATHGMLPSRYFLTGHLVIEHESVICIWGADVRRGTLDGLAVVVRSIPSILTGSSGGSQQVIFTTLDVHMQSYLTCLRHFQSAYREIITWKNLDHPNVLPLLGVGTSISPLFTISPHIDHGSLREYLARFPNAPRSKLVRESPVYSLTHLTGHLVARRLPRLGIHAWPGLYPW